MRLKFKLLIILFYLISSSNSLFALTLNKMQVNSKQDEPLNAVIDVIFSKSDKVENLRPAIASKENYEANGLSRLPIHSDIQIRLEGSGAGAKIFLVSEEIVKDPFLDLLIQIDSEKGRVYKEYTVLLEPPEPKVSLKEAKKVEAVKEAKKVEAVKEAKKVEAVKEAKKVEAVKEAKKVEAVKEAKKVEAVKKKIDTKVKIVKSTNKKTLYQIARENKPSGVTTEQMVLAIFRNNPNAFAEDNVNTLIKNKKLKVPGLDYFDDLTHLEARKILRDQNIAWKNKTIISIKPKKPIQPKTLKKEVSKESERITQLEKELLTTKNKLDEMSKLNKDLREKNSNTKKSFSLEESSQSKNDEESLDKITEIKDISEDKKDDGVFVSSISDIDENIIEETKIDSKGKKGLKTEHVLLLVLFVVLLFGLFVVTARRKRNDRNQKLKSFTDGNLNQNNNTSNNSEMGVNVTQSQDPLGREGIVDNDAPQATGTSEEIESKDLNNKSDEDVNKS